MAYSNRAIPMNQIQQTMNQFQKQNEMANMKEEMLDDIFDDEGIEEEG